MFNKLCQDVKKAVLYGVFQMLFYACLVNRFQYKVCFLFDKLNSRRGVGGEGLKYAFRVEMVCQK